MDIGLKNRRFSRYDGAASMAGQPARSQMNCGIKLKFRERQLEYSSNTVKKDS